MLGQSRSSRRRLWFLLDRDGSQSDASVLFWIPLWALEARWVAVICFGSAALAAVCGLELGDEGVAIAFPGVRPEVVESVFGKLSKFE